MKRPAFFIVAASLLPLTAVAASPTPVRPAASIAAKPISASLKVLDIPFQKFVLPNGLTLIVNEDHHQPIASVSLWYHVGSKNEAVGRTGFAHVFEHLMFNGSEHANDDWFKFLNPIGATSMNGTTGQDRTNFYETVPVSGLDRLLWLESDRMGHLLPAIDQAKLDEQRGVVQNEKRQRANSPFGAVPETIGTAVYPPGHPYSWQAIGSMADLNAASLDDVRGWFNTWYGAGNVVLVISGDVNPADMRQKVEKYFGFVPHGPALHRVDKWVAKRTGERRDTMQVAAPEGRVYKVWNVPAFGDPDADMLDIAATVLGDRVNGRLSRRLIDQDKLASSIGAENDSQELGGLFTLSVDARPGVDLGTVEKAMNEELARFLRDGPTQEELDRFKFSTYSDTVTNSEDLTAKGAILAQDFLYTGDPASYHASLQRQYDATIAQVRDVARAWLSDGDYVLYTTPAAAAAPPAPEVDRSTMPAIGGPAPLALVPPTRFNLSNGLKVELVERHSAPTFAMRLIFGSGVRADRNAPPSLGETATNQATKGTPTRSESEIANEEETLGTTIGWDQTDEKMLYGMTGLTATLPQSLDLYADMLVHPTFPQDIFERDRVLAIADIEQAKSTPGGKISRVLPPLLLGSGHPYAATPTAATLGLLTTNQLRDWYHRWVRPDNATLLIVGDVTESAIRPMLEQRLAEWKAPAGPIPTMAPLPAVPPPTHPRIFLIDQPGADQSTIALEELSVSRADPDIDAMSLANDVLGGGFVSRLNLNLREDKHWTYGAHTSLQPELLFGLFGVGTSVQTDKTADSLHEIDRELREVLTTRKPTDAELQTAKNGEVLTMANSFHSAGSTSYFYSDPIRFGLSDDYWNKYVGRIEAITLPQLTAAAVKLDHPDQMTWVVVGDLSKIEASVRALGIGEVHVIDADGKQLR